ncbi:trigger factor-like protein TIG, Chloroplastic [Tripterygium wilfordii]|uniref:trigger factor-like protein TIG, Chloroplastic n=1 Tax=Tripterygium wilfordii TaxID=458696 RepID=UPI0018F83A4C|nr:trigger factor-like protein TIG, Chloroplastic [Tripterygium wilfordii]
MLCVFTRSPLSSTADTFLHRPTMELGIRISPTKLINVNSISLSLLNPFLQFKNPQGSSNPHKLLSFSRQVHLQQLPQFHRCSSRFKALASPSAVFGAEKDQLLSDIRITETQEPNLRVRLSVEIPPNVCEDCYKEVIRELMKKAKVPGFRPGKQVPESVLVGFVGKKMVEQATIESILKRTLPHALSSVSGKALRDTVRITTKFSDMEKTYSTLKSIRYDAIVDLAPKVKWIPEDAYKNLKVIVEIDCDIEAQRAVDQELRRRHKSLGSLRIIIDRGLQIGDVAVLDISATTIDQDESNVQNIPAAESKGFHFDTEEGDKVLPGFLDSIFGIRRGEKKSFPLVFPESWKQENLRGVQAQFTVECKELFYRDLPELDDSFAEKLIPGSTTIRQVKESLLQRYQEVEQTAKEQATDNAILDQLRQMVEVDIPQSLFEEQGRQLYGTQLLQMQATMKLNEKQLAYLSSAKAVDEYLEHKKENIINLIKQNLAVADIFERENLQFSTEELVKEIENSVEEFKRSKVKYDEERVKEQVQEILEGAKVLEWLREHAEIEYITK